MLKKAGIVVAAATAGLLALSPLAFADSDGDSYRYDSSFDSSYDERYDETNTLNNSLNKNDVANIEKNNVNVPAAVCGNDVPVNVLGVQVTDIVADLDATAGLLAEDTQSRGGNNETGDERNCSQDIENNN